MIRTVHGRRVKYQEGQQTTLPIKDKETILAIYSNLELKKQKARTTAKRYLADRNYLLFAVGINTAFRAEDLLQLKVKDFSKGYVRYVIENKTMKVQSFKMNGKLADLINGYVERWKLFPNDYLFRGQQKKQDGKVYGFPITRQQAYRLIRLWGEEVGIASHFGVHTLRKTFGYHYYRNGGDLLTLSKLYNHCNPTVTLHYVCWENADVSKARIDSSLLP